MKKSAVLILMVFLLVQVYPAIKTFISDSVTMIVMDNEKEGEGMQETNKKEKVDFTEITQIKYDQPSSLNKIFRLKENIQPSPSLELQNPPPNYC